MRSELGLVRGGGRKICELVKEPEEEEGRGGMVAKSSSSTRGAMFESCVTACFRRLMVEETVLRDGERPASDSCKTDGGAEPAIGSCSRHSDVKGVSDHYVAEIDDIRDLPDAVLRGVPQTPPSLDLFILAASLAALRRRYS